MKASVPPPLFYLADSTGTTAATPGTTGRRQPVKNWAKIPPTCQIVLIQEFQQIAGGWVDDVMPDGSGIWLRCKDDGQRRFFLREEGVSAVRVLESC